MRYLLCGLLTLVTVGCGDAMLTAPSQPPYQSQYDPHVTPRDPNACKDFGFAILCPNH